MIRNSQEFGKARRLLIGINALSRGITRMSSNYSEYRVETVAEELVQFLKPKIDQLSREIEQYQTGYRLSDGSAKERLTSLLEALPDIPECFLEARLMTGADIEDIGQRVGLTKAQLSKLESRRYEAIPLGKAIELSRIMLQEFAHPGAFCREETDDPDEEHNSQQLDFALQSGSAEQANSAKQANSEQENPSRCSEQKAEFDADTDSTTGSKQLRLST